MNYGDMGYGHLLSGPHALLLAMTVFGFILIQFILFCSMEWNSQVMDGLNSYQKVVGSLFQTVNSRHTGGSVVDLSSISAAIPVLFVVMMYVSLTHILSRLL
nr:sodium transporter hkt1 [Quercus suber]